ncbi:MAG: hypothetical protein D6744_13730 [Planctomycetota bacterium]|nr:MAG: hypothetical protein D6744_13730 [Planctomycetota bacterium]
MRQPRRPQINFQVEPCLKTLYDEARESGHWVTRLCAAGFLLMVEDADARMRAINRLRDWLAEYDDADPDEIRAFVQNAQAAMTTRAPGSRPARKPPRAKRKAKRSGSG